MSKVLSHRHAFHLVDPSPWPFIASFAGLTLTSGQLCGCMDTSVVLLFYVWVNF